MHYLKIYFSLFILLFLNSTCLESTVTPETDNVVYGTWVEKSRDDQILILSEADSLDVNKYGFIISSSGKFTERKNSGWCGTPPVSYADFEGKWEFESDKLIKIEVGYWGGVTQYKIKIISIEDDELRIEYIYDY